MKALSATGRKGAKEAELDDQAIQALENPGLQEEIADGIVARAKGPRVKYPSRYATTAARRAAKQGQERENEGTTTEGEEQPAKEPIEEPSGQAGGGGEKG